MKTSRKNSKQRSRQFKKHAKRLAAYSAAAAATVLTAGDRSANAAEVVWNIPDVTVRDGGETQRGVVFNMTNGSIEINRPHGGPDPNGTRPRKSGSAKVVRPSPPYVVPNREKSAVLLEMASNCP